MRNVQSVQEDFTYFNINVLNNVKKVILNLHN